MYEPRDVGSFLIMLAVLPLFLVVFAIVLAVYVPFALAYEVVKWLTK
jgi:hypothetical protein